MRRLYVPVLHEQHEFDLIWKKQQAHHDKVLTDTNRKLIRDAIFHQRPLKSQKHLVGRCTFEPDRKRGAIATIAAQDFRLWSSINNMRLLLQTEKNVGSLMRNVTESTKDASLKKEMTWKAGKTTRLSGR